MPVTGVKRKEESIVSRVKDLPTLPAIIQKLLIVLNDMGSSIKDIERIIATDPALTAKILRLANSPLYKGIDSVTTVSQAVTRLGFWTLRDMAIHIGATETLTGMAGEKDQMDFWNHAVYTATGAKIIAERAGHPIPEEPFVTGLLHDIGQLVFAALNPAEYRLYRKLDSASRMPNEDQLFGATHPRIGNMLLRQWQLPKPLCDAVRLHHTEMVITSKREPIITIVALADQLSRIQGYGSEPLLPAKVLFKMIKRTGIGIDAIGDILRGMDKQVADTRNHLEIAETIAIGPRAMASGQHDVAVVSSDQSVLQWYEQLLSYLGHTLLPVDEFFENPETADLVILDAQNLDTEQMDEIQSNIEELRSRTMVLNQDPAQPLERLEDWELPETDLFLTLADINSYVSSS